MTRPAVRPLNEQHPRGTTDNAFTMKPLSLGFAPTVAVTNAATQVSPRLSRCADVVTQWCNEHRRFSMRDVKVEGTDVLIHFDIKYQGEIYKAYEARVKQAMAALRMYMGRAGFADVKLVPTQYNLRLPC
jgi:hypothetical protein